MTANGSFKAVYEFCGGDDDLYFEILEEIQGSITNLNNIIDQQDATLEELRFLAHKMKSTFRILKDENYKILLDTYVEASANDNQQDKNTSGAQLVETGKAYLKSLQEALSKRS